MESIEQFVWALATLPNDIIGQCLRYLNGEDLISLMQTGNRQLRHKLAHNCHYFEIYPCHNTRFPFAALKLPALKSLSLSGHEEVISYVNYMDGVETSFNQVCKSIEEINFRIANASAFLLPIKASIPRLPIRDRFPSLTKLILHDFICEEQLKDEVFGEFPETLTFLSLKAVDPLDCNDCDNDFCVTTISKLPRQLKSLELLNFCIGHFNSENVAYEDALPPNLTHLALDDIYDVPILSYLPSSLTTLRFGWQSCGTAPQLDWKLSTIPPGLVSLSIGLFCDGLQVVEDAPLPSTLESVDYGVGFEGFSLETLPGSLKTAPKYLFTYDDDIKMLQNFENLEYASIWRERTSVAIFPTCLKALVCRGPCAIDSPLPNGLTELVLSVLPNHIDLANIPSSLTSLSALGSELSIFSPWGRKEFVNIASWKFLSTLTISWTDIHSGYSLAPLAGMNSLKNFDISSVPWRGLLETPEWLPQCLPATLRTFAMSTTNDAPLSRALEEDFFSGWNLQTVTPSLTSLEINCRYVSRQFIIPLSTAFFASLPRGLLSLLLNIAPAALELDAIAQLPRTIQLFGLVSLEKSNSLSDNHFRGLPPLPDFNLLYSALASVTPNIYNILPKSIVRMHFTPDPEESDQEFERRTNFLYANRSRYHPSRDERKYNESVDKAW